MAPALQVTDDGPVRVLTLDRPERLNALSPGLVDDLHGALADARGAADCLVLVLTGAGRGFCAGLDLGDWCESAGVVTLALEGGAESR